MIAAPRLACEQCKRRKSRCNKESPCSSCKRNGLQCHTVQRARLPRGKSGKAQHHNARLEARVARIETLLGQQTAISTESCSTPSTDPFRSSGMSSTTGSKEARSQPSSDGQISSFVAPEFWNVLSEEISGLRQTLESIDEQDDHIDTEYPKDTRVPEPNHESTNAGMILFSRLGDKYPNSLVSPPPETREKLLQLYRFRVDVVYKVLHWPTVLSMMEAAHADPTATSGKQSSQCLEWSIYFMATCSITNKEAKEMGMGDRLDTLDSYRCTVEDLFAKSSLLQNPDLVLLQAFVIYLIGLRTCLNSADTWTLVAVAIRAATALRLGDESLKTHTAFDVELRRRLLFAIGILDTHSALDRGTVPILPSTAFRNPPLRINDQDMAPNKVPRTSSTGPTDMSHTAMIYEAMVCQRKLYELSESAHNAQDHWQEKLELVDAFGKYVPSIALSVETPVEPLHRLQHISGTKIHVSLQLLLRRPPYRQLHNTVPLWDDFDVLDAAVRVLEQHLQPLLPGMEPWAWKNWVQWHALAVVLAELTVRPRGSVSERAYSIATKSFRHYARIVADSDSGMLWKPIARLMRRVQQMRKSAFPMTTSVGKVLPTEPGPISKGPDTSMDLIDTDVFQDLHMFDTTNWALDNEGPNEPFEYEKFSHHIENNGMEDESSTPLSAWDYFLQDIDLQDL